MKEIGLKTIAKTVAGTALYTTMGPTGLLLGKAVEKAVDYINDSTEEENDRLIDKFNEAYSNNRYKDALELLELLRGEIAESVYYYFKGRCYDGIYDEESEYLESECERLGITDETEDDDPLWKAVAPIEENIDAIEAEIIQNLSRALDINDEGLDDSQIQNAHYLLSIHDNIIEEGRRHAIAAMENTSLFEVAKKKYIYFDDIYCHAIIDKNPNYWWEDKDNSYARRQFIYIARDARALAGCYDDNIYWTFETGRIPSCLRFPAGHPQANSLYYAHPADHGYYIPYKQANEVLFLDKVSAFCQFVQSLGATEISFRALKGKNLEETSINTIGLSGGGAYHGVEASGCYNNNRRSASSLERHDQRSVTQKYAPLTYPCIPKDNAWYNVDRDWQRLAKQRLEGNLLTYTLKISSSETMTATNAQMDSVEAAFNHFVAKGCAKFTMEGERSYKRTEETEWEICVKFKPLNEFSIQANREQIITPLEQEYLNEYREIIADGEISDRDRRFLDKIKKANGISDTRAKKLESMSTPTLTAEEQEYLNEYKEIIADGEISARDQRFLDKLKKANGISEDRAKEIESMA